MTDKAGSTDSDGQGARDVLRLTGEDRVEDLGEGRDLLGIDEFEQFGLPRRLFHVTLRKS